MKLPLVLRSSGISQKNDAVTGTPHMLRTSTTSSSSTTPYGVRSVIVTRISEPGYVETTATTKHCYYKVVVAASRTEQLVFSDGLMMAAELLITLAKHSVLIAVLSMPYGGVWSNCSKVSVLRAP